MEKLSNKDALFNHQLNAVTTVETKVEGIEKLKSTSTYTGMLRIGRAFGICPLYYEAEGEVR